jgi:hypothetical protein
MNIESACKERDEQKKAPLSKMSTSYSEAFLAGQCIGYEKITYTYTYSNINFDINSFAELPNACSEFVEKKEALLPFVSTSLSEAMLAGMCVGAIYNIANKCDGGQHIEYLNIAKSIKGLNATNAANRIAYSLSCSE